jgi:NADH:ubiquinone oxidoreductase subunit 3 (subunit A)
VSTYFGIRAGLDQSRTPQERRRVFKVAATLCFYPIAFVGLLYVLRQLALNSAGHAEYYALGIQVYVIAFLVSYVILVNRMLRGSRLLRSQERERHPDAFESAADRAGSSEREYKSRLRLLGIPLFHFRLGMPEKDDGPVIGWLAGGDRAYGLLFAWGAVAVAPISVGIYSVGVVAVGVMGLGLVGLGTVGIGIVGFGVAAIAYQAYASDSALGWESAFSQGVSIAWDGAIGPVAMAQHVNNEQAAEIANLAAFGQTYLWVLGAIAILVIVPAIWYSNKVRQKMAPRSSGKRSSD